MFVIKWHHWLLLVICMSITISYHFKAVLLSPSSTLMATEGDGLKNYLTPLLHVKNSHSYHHFDSMNYPYGEHVLFTDNQPLISNALRFWQRNFNEVTYHTTGVLNIALLLSLLIASCFIYYFLRSLLLPHWYSLIAAIAVSWLSPQLLRFGGHYALGYMAILLTLLYFLKGFETKAWKWSRRIIALNLLAPMIHFYYFGIAALFLSIFYALKWLKERHNYKFYLLHWSSQLILPFVFFNFIWLKIDNAVTDRPDAPFGFLHYVSTLEGTFFRKGNLLYDVLNQYAFAFPNMDEFESWNYVGFAALCFVVLSLVSVIFTRKIALFDTEIKAKADLTFFQTAFWASFLLFIFSLGVPFIFPNCEFLLQYTGPLKQFRGLGRFSWMFFFMVNLLAFYAIYHWGERIKSIELRRVFWLFFLLIALKEGFTNVEKIGKPRGLYEEMNLCGEPMETWAAYMDKSKYQAILPVPYYHLGAEYLGIEMQEHSLAYNLFASYQSGLPSMGVMMSRTSWQQALSSLPLGMEFYREPPVLQQLPNQKPLLIMENKAWHQKTKNRYQPLLNKATKIHENQAFALYELPIDGYQKVIREQKELIKKEAEKPSLILQNNGLWCEDSSKASYFYSDFDNQVAAQTYRGKGALQFNATSPKVVFQQHLSKQQNQQRYQLQFWINIEKGIHARSNFSIKEWDNQGELQYYWFHGCLHNIVALDGHWALVSFPFQPKLNDTTIEVSLINEETASPLCIDELLIIPQGAEIFKKESNGDVMKNGRWY